MLEFLRLIGNMLSIIGYIILINVDPLLGSIIKIIGLFLVVPFCLKLKLWDVVVVFGFFVAIDIANIIKIVF